MWFDGSTGLTLLDGTFVSHWNPISDTVLSNVNEPSALAQDTSDVVARRIDIPVLGGAPTRYKLLAPHQDPQFLANRPFFYMDSQRAFVVTSTGSSHLVTNPFTWVLGDLARWASPAARIPVTNRGAAPAPAPSAITAVTLLERGAQARAWRRQLNTFNLAPTSALHGAFSPRFWSDRAYDVQELPPSVRWPVHSDAGSVRHRTRCSLSTARISRTSIRSSPSPTPRVGEGVS